MATIDPNTLQLWTGLECTINRVGDRWADQSRLNGHDERGVADLSAIAGLGVTTMRYPVLWEAVAPESLDEARWDEADERLGYLRERGIDVIAGLLHHGSGPAYTSLVDEDFPAKLARYAALVAHRYPWLELYTPVNEPLTTARFSGLYGVWYPHGRDDATFARALYNEVRGTVLAMREIRAVNPRARLVQTEDLGRMSGTAPVQRQVDHENNRRWLSLDLLQGHVTPAHPLYGYLTGPGALTAEQLTWLEHNPCPPDVIGVNHYLLSNRFLDHETEWYPEAVPRGRLDGIDYADVPALETARATSPTIEAVLEDVWLRYPGIPSAVTEVHIDGNDDLRRAWLWEVWCAAEHLRERGAPVIAVTAWSLLGTYDWNTLCTTSAGKPMHYEPGVFDVRTGTARPTAVADLVRSLIQSGTYDDAGIIHNPYWRTRERLRYAIAD
jgi:dTDP-4-dehydrorhamnose reductase